MSPLEHRARRFVATPLPVASDATFLGCIPMANPSRRTQILRFRHPDAVRDAAHGTGTGFVKALPAESKRYPPRVVWDSRPEDRLWQSVVAFTSGCFYLYCSR
jgi:hypothetical protein